MSRHGASVRDSPLVPAFPLISEQRTVNIERNSPRDQLIVILFLLTVFGLLLGAGIKNRMMEAGITAPTLPWQTANRRRWWEVSLPFCNWLIRRLILSRPGFPEDRNISVWNGLVVLQIEKRLCP
jgi:hypothetical protein